MPLQKHINALCWIVSICSYAFSFMVEESVAGTLIAGVGVVVALWYGFYRSYGFWDPCCIYLTMSSLYVLSPLVEIAIFANTLQFDEKRMIVLAKAGVGYLFAAAFTMALLRGRDHLRLQARSSHERVGYELQACKLILIVLLVAYVGLLVGHYGVAIGSLSRAELYAQEFVALSLVRLSLTIALIYAFSLTAADQGFIAARQAVPKWLIAVTAVFIGFDLLILGDRRMGLTLILAIAPIYLNPKVELKHLMAISVVAVLLLFFSFVRNAPPSEWLARLGSVDLLPQLSPAAAEFGVGAAIGGAIEHLGYFPADFPTYPEAVLQFVPRFIMANRPDAPSEWFVWHYFPDYAATGGSLAFNSVVEAIGNGGFVAVPIVGALYGAALGALTRVSILGARVGLGFATFIFAFSMRMELAVVLRNVLYVATVMTLILFACAVVRAVIIKHTGSR